MSEKNTKVDVQAVLDAIEESCAGRVQIKFVPTPNAPWHRRIVTHIAEDFFEKLGIAVMVFSWIMLFALLPHG